MFLSYKPLRYSKEYYEDRYGTFDNFYLNYKYGTNILLKTIYTGRDVLYNNFLQLLFQEYYHPDLKPLIIDQSDLADLVEESKYADYYTQKYQIGLEKFKFRYPKNLTEILLKAKEQKKTLFVDLDIIYADHVGHINSLIFDFTTAAILTRYEPGSDTNYSYIDTFFKAFFSTTSNY